MPKIFIFTNGCEQRSLDARKFSTYFRKNNYVIVNRPEEADIIFFITCAFIDTVAQKSLSRIKEFQKYEAELIVAGCLPIIDKEKLLKIFNGKTIGTYYLDKKPELVDALFPENKIKFNEIKDENVLFPSYVKKPFFVMITKLLIKLNFFREILFKLREYVIKNIYGQGTSAQRFLSNEPRFVVRISWGCYGNCAYCGIKKAIGGHKSKPLEVCLEEFKKGLKLGYKRFVLISDDTGAYGLDIGSSMPELLEKITQLDGEYEIELYNVHPEWIVKYINSLEKIMKNKKITYIESPLTHGSPRVLKLMRRYSDTEKMKDAFLKLKKINPDLQLFANIIIGFPTETEEELFEALSFAKDCGFNSGFVYKFSLRSGTPAEKIQPHYSEEEKTRRLKKAAKIMKRFGFTNPHIATKEPFFYFEKRA